MLAVPETETAPVSVTLLPAVTVKLSVVVIPVKSIEFAS